MKPKTITLRPNETDSRVSAKWQTAKENVFKHVFAAINEMSSSHDLRALDNAKYLALYENLDQAVPGMPSAMQNRFTSKLAFNVIKSCIDSVSAEVAKTKPKPEFVTSDGDYRLQKKAELLTQYIEGVFYDNKVYTDHGPDAFVDGSLFGTGALAVINTGERIVYERVLIDEIYVDEFDGLYRRPKTMMHVRRVFRDTLRERFQDNPEALRAIADAPDAPVLSGDMNGANDMILVAEAWYLPHKVKQKPEQELSKKERKAQKEDSRTPQEKGVAGGRYAVCLENFDLLVTEYTKDYFPFVFFRWNNKRMGFMGQGLAEELVPLQLEIARTLSAIAKNMKFSGLRVFLETGSQINPNHLDDEGSKGIPVTTFAGTPPIVQAWAPNAPEIYSYLENLYRKAFEISGISQMMAFSQKPGGITAAKALETLNDNQSRRFQLIADRYEQFYMDLAEMTIDQSRDLYKENPDLSIKTIHTDGFLSEIKWKDVDMDSDRFRMRAFPINAFSDTPAARLQEVTAAVQAGWLTPQRAQQLLEIMPDFKEAVSLQTSSLQRVRKQLDNIIYEGRYLHNEPDVYLDLDEALTIAQATFNKAKTQGVEEHKLSLIRDYIEDVQSLQAAAAGPPAPMMPPPDPMATPQAAPTSDLLPIGGAAGGDPGAPAVN